MNNTVLLSIIIPVYRVERYIERCLLSVMGQTYQTSSIECVLIDDCGGDDSMAIAEKLINSYLGPISFRIVRNEKNCGIATTRNVGIRNASGEFIFFLDSDDRIEQNCIEVLLEALQKNPDAEVVMGNAYYVQGNRKWLIEKRIPNGIIHNHKLLDCFFHGYIPDTVWNALIRKDIIEKNGIWFNPGYVHEDMLWLYRLYHHVEKFVFVPKITLVYEDNPVSIMNTIHKDYNPHLRSVVYNIEYILDNFSYAHYVNNTIYVLWYVIHELDMIEKESAEPGLVNRLKAIRNRITKRDFLNLRLVLVFFELQMFYPFSLFRKNGWFRHNYYAISMLTRKVALFFSPLHFFEKK